MHLVFVLPTKNEALTIGPLISQIRNISSLNNWRSTIVVTDDSSDETPELARKEGAVVLNAGMVGLGQAMMLGLSEALCLKPDWIFSLDSDGQVDTEEIPIFMKAALANNVDLVVSSRFLNADSIEYHYPLVNWLGNRMLVGFLRIATGYPFTDSHGGIRLMKPRVLIDLELIGRHTYVQETLIQICRRGYKVIELPSCWKPRHQGNSRVLQSILKYVVRTLPGLLFHIRFHFVAFLTASVLSGYYYFQKPNSSFFILVCAAALFLSSLIILLFARHPLKITGHSRD